MFSKQPFYSYGILIFWIASLLLILFTPKLELHQALNSYHTSFLDTIAKYATNVGDGLFFVIIALIFLFISIQKSVVFLLSFLLSAGITQFLKHFVYASHFRPMHHFQNVADFHKIDGLTYHFANSFPSGHSTSCFALFTVFVLFYSSKKSWQMVFLLAAISFAFTRVYLSQHFFEDVFVGSLIGTLTAYFIYFFIGPKLEKWNYSILNRPKKD
ncbi:MAG: phosphatase PAP2 family protein [Flavobacteriales bacterium]|nr:phosphatase PAP2 family protein [Flavobacteriales bacterium]